MYNYHLNGGEKAGEWNEKKAFSYSQPEVCISGNDHLIYRVRLTKLLLSATHPQPFNCRLSSTSRNRKLNLPPWFSVTNLLMRLWHAWQVIQQHMFTKKKKKKKKKNRSDIKASLFILPFYYLRAQFIRISESLEQISIGCTVAMIMVISSHLQSNEDFL